MHLAFNIWLSNNSSSNNNDNDDDDDDDEDDDDDDDDDNDLWYRPLSQIDRLISEKTDPEYRLLWIWNVEWIRIKVDTGVRNLMSLSIWDKLFKYRQQ